MPECEVCGGDDFEELHGHFYCTVCQTQSQDVRVLEAAEDYVDFAGVTNRLKEPKKDRPKKTGKDQGRPWSVYEAYQIIIQHQVEALIKLGAQESLKDIVFKLWVNYLAKLGVAFSEGPKSELLKKHAVQREMFPSTTKKPRIKNVLGRKRRRKTVGVSAKTAEKMQVADTMTEALAGEEFYEGDNPLADNDDDDDDYSSEDNEEETQWERVGRTVWSKSCYKMQMSYTLVFCYMGLLYTNPGTTVSDLLRWARKGQVPYLNAVSIIPEDFKFCMSDWSFFSKGKIPSASTLRYITGRLVIFLGLTGFPSFPLSELISKYILILDLPAEMHSLVINLYKCKRVMIDYRPTKQYCKIPFWEGLALSYIIITLKLYFGLNDHTERLFSVYSRELMKLIDYNHQLFIWEDWVKHMKIKCQTSDHFIVSSQHEESVESISEEASAVKESIKYISIAHKLYQPRVREKITEPFIELGKRWTARKMEREKQLEKNVTCDTIDDINRNTFMDDDPVGFLLGHYEHNGELENQSSKDDKYEQAKQETKQRSEQFQKSSLKHLSNPGTYLDELDRHGLSDYTILSSCTGSVNSDEEGKPEAGCLGDTDWDPDFSQMEERNYVKDSEQSNSQASLRKFIKANIKPVPSSLKVVNKERYQFVIEQVQKLHETFLLTFDYDQYSASLSYNWLLQICSLLIDCPSSELADEVRKVEVVLFAESFDVSKRGRYNFKRLKKRNLNCFTKRLKQF